MRRETEELINRTPADGLVAGTALVNGELFGERAACAVLSYDYTVLAGTQGATGHRKKDRLFELIAQLRPPTVSSPRAAAGGPATATTPSSPPSTPAPSRVWGRLSGVVPRIAVVSGRCFAGNAVIAGAADLIVATESTTLGMGGPAMVEGGGLGTFPPEAIGPIDVQAANGVIDVRVTDEAEAVAVTKRLLAYFQGATALWEAPDQALLRDVVPERRRRAYDVHAAIDGLADVESVTYLREELPRRWSRRSRGSRGARSGSSPTTRCASPVRSRATGPTRTLFSWFVFTQGDRV